MLNMLYLRQRAGIGLDGLKVVILTLKSKTVQDSRTKFEDEDLSHHFMKIAVRPLNNCLIR